MMKNSFFLLLLIMLCTSVSAQRFCDLQVIGGVSGTTINIDASGATPTYFDLYLRNNGADTLKETDTVYFSSDFLTGGGRAYISPVILDPGGEINIKDTFYFETGPADGSTYELCDSVWFTSMAADLAIDTVIPNNRNCQTLKVIHIKPSAIQEPQAEAPAYGTLLIHPNPASQLVSLDFVAGNSSEVECLVYEVSGRLVLRHNFGPSFKGQSGYQLDISSLQEGLYFISLKQEGVQLSGKLLRQ